MEPKSKVILLLAIMIVPIVVLIIGVSNLTALGNDDLLVDSQYDYTESGEQILEYYYIETYICDNTYTFDSVTFTHKNYAKLQWNPYNSTHYQLNISMISQDRTPSGYILFGATNHFDVNVTVQSEEINTYLALIGIYGSTSYLLSYFRLEELEQLVVNINIEMSNTHNSDSGDITVYGHKKYDITILDPAHNDGLNFLFLMLMVAGIISTVGLVIPVIIIMTRELRD